VDKSKDKYGSIFMDYRNNFDDKKILIYGHNSTKLDPPFRDLEKYANKTFYEKYPYIEYTTEKGKYKYIIFSVMISEKGNYRHTVLNFNNENEWNEHLKWMKDNSVYDTQIDVDINDEILTLQTCYYEPKDSYLIINAKKIKGEI
jgi:sortase B